MDLPPAFLERYLPLVDDPAAFQDSLQEKPPKSFRVNTLKAAPQEVQERFSEYGIALQAVPWYPDAFVSSEPAVGQTLDHALGLIYLQDLASMLPPLALLPELEQLRDAPEPEEQEPPVIPGVLDACAAPGSKAGQLAALLQGRSLVVANDVSWGRTKALRFNLEKMGATNAVVMSRDLRSFPACQFPLILLDAPCSAEGTACRNPLALERWKPRLIQRLARIQQRLLLAAFDHLLPGGVLVYSTCTFAPEENEGVAEFLLQQRSASLEPLRFPGLRSSPGLTAWEGEDFSPDLSKAVRVWPHQNRTEGFFLAKIRKARQGNPEPAGRGQLPPLLWDTGGRDVAAVRSYLGTRFQVATSAAGWYASPKGVVSRGPPLLPPLPLQAPGVHAATVQEGRVKPSTMGLQLLGGHARKNRVNLSAEQAREYIAGEDIGLSPPPAGATDGYVLLTVRGLPLGCGLLQAGVVRNVLPKAMRQAIRWC
ncbi:MAG: NOL1/NOP2/sun family putative RNA methylase [Candidatus Aenigmarchaeota archaeon]|nr:NOL1/NOP2/sun family putative RNA methylase [Candidatus Aenigmarchaeota archaeon]